MAGSQSWLAGKRIARARAWAIKTVLVGSFMNVAFAILAVLVCVGWLTYKTMLDHRLVSAWAASFTTPLKPLLWLALWLNLVLVILIFLAGLARIVYRAARGPAGRGLYPWAGLGEEVWNWEERDAWNAVLALAVAVVGGLLTYEALWPGLKCLLRPSTCEAAQETTSRTVAVNAGEVLSLPGIAVPEADPLPALWVQQQVVAESSMEVVFVPTAAPPPAACETRSQEIFFAPEAADISNQGIERIRKAANDVRSQPGHLAILTGFADPVLDKNVTGGLAALAKARGLAVRRQLVTDLGNSGASTRMSEPSATPAAQAEPHNMRVRINVPCPAR